MAWLDYRMQDEAACHATFQTPGTVTPTTGPAFAVDGVLHERQEAAALSNEIGMQEVDFIYEVRLDAATGPHATSQFPISGNRYGRLVLPTGAYEIQYVHRNATLIYLGLGGVA